MPTDFPLLSGWPASAAPNPSNIRQALAAAYPLIVASASAAADLDLTGYGVLELRLNGVAFLYDPADTTTAHDGSTCLVTYDGKRFKREEVALVTNVVLDRDLTSPPGSPSVGDQYLVATSPSGSWAAHEDEVAIYTARGWLFKAPFVGMTLYVADEDVYVRYVDGGTWEDGLGNNVIGDGTIGPDQLTYPFGLSVEAQQDSPPGSPPGAGVAYLVGTSPTGAWTGHGNDVAIADGAGNWTFYTPAEGNGVYDKDQGLQVYWKSGSWRVDIDSPILQAIYGTYNSSLSLNSSYQTLDTLTFQLQRSTSLMRVTLHTFTTIASGNGSVFDVDLLKDSDTSATRNFIENQSTTVPSGASTPGNFTPGAFAVGLGWGSSVLVAVGDTDPHNWHLKAKRTSGSGSQAFNLTWMIEEIAATLA